ncbi:MAG: outer membrane beta-barrel protein [Williamsia sp.]|nr:outer membrane beta-barrel protein [Williamsia sp.]
MKKFYFLVAGLCLYGSSFAQTDTSANKTQQSDTIRIGTMIIVKKRRNSGGNDSPTTVTIEKKHSRPSNVTTNWGIVDLGFNNYTDNTNYASAAAQQFAPGGNKDWFKLHNGKSVNVNIWFFMQRLNLVSHVVNLKYGLGLELNNYRYESNIRFKENPTSVYMDNISYHKNKLAADYLTVPLMLNFNLRPGKDNDKSFGLSAGVSAGYLYSSRQKIVSGQTGKTKVKDDFDLRNYKLSYIAELHLGPVNLYGSLATQSMFEKGLDQTPYNIGIRIGKL